MIAKQGIYNAQVKVSYVYNNNNIAHFSHRDFNFHSGISILGVIWTL